MKSPTRTGAAASTTVRGLMRGELRPALVLGAFPTAIYLRLEGNAVIALLARDAGQLPLGLRLPTHSADQPLNQWAGPVLVGLSRVETRDRLADGPLRAAVLEATPERTTDLSAALLRCASRGESIPQVSALLSALSDHNASRRSLDGALGKLVDVGNSSGAAMTLGVVAAARVAARVGRPDAVATLAATRSAR